MQKRRGKEPNLKCNVCGKEFYRKPFYLKQQGWGKYCSLDCKSQNQRNGKFVKCAYCGRRIYRNQSQLHKPSITKSFFCNLSCHCAWKNKKRRKKVFKKLWRSWCNSSIRTCGVLGADANSVDLPTKFSLGFLRPKSKSARHFFLKKPSKKQLYNLYWKENYTQGKIAEVFNVTHTSVKRWFLNYRIPIKPRTLSCGQNLNSLENLKLGLTREVQRRSAESRKKYSKEKLVKIIQDFVKREGRIPTKNEFANNSFYPDYVTFRDYFGTWNNAIIAAGYEPNERWFCPRNLTAKDGHKCNSFSEIIIDDWLLKNRVFHQREVVYPEKRYRCDFVISGAFVEFFGLTNASGISSDYNEIIKKKRRICRKYRIKLIELYEKDLYNLDRVMARKLNLKSLLR